jgi:hypothetical protein
MCSCLVCWRFATQIVSGVNRGFPIDRYVTGAVVVSGRQPDKEKTRHARFR